MSFEGTEGQTRRYAGSSGLAAAAAAVPARLSATVAICAYTPRRWDILVEAVEAVRRQLVGHDQLIIVIDHAPDLLASARARFEDVAVIENVHGRGLSGARNTAVEAASGEVVVFLDDDAVPEPGWLDALVAPYRDDSVVGVGGYVLPRWPASKPWWLPPEFLWVVGCSYSGLPGAMESIRNPIGASMAFRRSVFEQTGLFSEALGRVGTVPVGCEETELSLRVATAFPDGRIVHEPSSVVHHQVSEDRTTFTYFRQRCWSEGASKAIVTHARGRRGALVTERRYLLATLSVATARELRHLLSGDLRAFVRALVLAAGAGITGVSYLSHLRRGPVSA